MTERETHMTDQSTWHVEGNQVFEGDQLIADYESPGSASYAARLHNNHQSTNAVLSQIDEMFQSEINFTVKGFWDGGISWSLDGDAGYDAEAAERGLQGVAPTIEEALVALRNGARRNFPRSLFAQRNGFDLELQTAQGTIAPWTNKAEFEARLDESLQQVENGETVSLGEFKD